MGIRTRILAASLGFGLLAAVVWGALVSRLLAVSTVAHPKLVIWVTAVVVGTGTALLIGVTGYLVQKWAVLGVRVTTAVARKMATGDLGARTRASGHGDVVDLGVAIDNLAEGMSQKLGTLREERDLLGAILDGMREGVLVIDGRGAVLRINPALREMLLLGSDVVGKLLMEVVRHAELKELLDRARAETQPVTAEFEIAGLKPRKLSVRSSRLVEQGGLLLAVFVDVTDVRRLESLRRDFVANVSHELRTPVTAIRTAAETLSMAAENDVPSIPRFIDIIERNATRLHNLIEDLLDLSRIESKEYKLTLDRVNLGRFVVQAVSLFKDRAEERGVQLFHNVPEGLPLAIADRRALDQVLANLIDNAIKYCPGCEIHLGAAVEGDKLRVTVRDTGPGIEAKHLPRLFERFYRVDPGRSRDVGGTGLGLSIVKHLAEAMGGGISVASTIGAGTTFTVVLKASTAPAAATSTSALLVN